MFRKPPSKLEVLQETVADTLPATRRMTGHTHARWSGRSDRARLLQGLETRPRVVGVRS